MMYMPTFSGPCLTSITFTVSIQSEIIFYICVRPLDLFLLLEYFPRSFIWGQTARTALCMCHFV